MTKVIVRSRMAGCHYGDLISIDGQTVKLENARQMWRWFAAEGGTLFDCATKGVVPNKCKFSSPASVTLLEACAVIEVDATAIPSLDGAKWAY